MGCVMVVLLARESIVDMEVVNDIHWGEGGICWA